MLHLTADFETKETSTRVKQPPQRISFFHHVKKTNSVNIISA